MRRIISIIVMLIFAVGLLPTVVTAASNTPVSGLEVYLQDNVVARQAYYQIRFQTNQLLSGGRDTITLKFPEAVEISDEIEAQNISVNNYNTEGIDYNDGVLSILVPKEINILTGQTVEIGIANAVIKNPKQAGEYTLSVYTSQNTLAATSPEFTITDYEYSNGVSKPYVRLGLVSGDKAPEYKINFRTSVNGAIGPGGKISLTFPNGTTIPATIDRRHITINDVELYYAPAINGRTVTLTVPALSIAGGGAVEIIIAPEADIARPSDSLQNTIRVSTSTESREIISFAWTVASGRADGSGVPTAGLAVSAVPNGRGLEAAYNISMVSGSLKSLGSTIGTLVVAFPPGTALPAMISVEKITVNGQQAAACMIDRHLNAIVISLQAVLNSSSQITINIDKSAGIKNPAAAQHKLDIGLLRTSNTVLSDWFTIYEQSTVESSTSTTTSPTTSVPSSGSASGDTQKIELPIDSNLAYADGALKMLDAAPLMIDNVTMVPLRFVSEYLGASAAYDGVTASATIKLASKEIILWAGSKMARVNGTYVPMNAETVNINNRLMVPVRFVSENLGAKVSWDEATRLITIEANGAEQSTVPQTSAQSRVYVEVEGSVYLRSGPDTTYESVGSLYQGESALIIERGNSWYKVRLDSGLEAWVASWVVEVR